MREILFRGKRIDNGEWVCGFYVGDTGCGCHEICDLNSVTGHRVEVDPDTVGQYTGLVDKNDNRIFEGDICKDSLGGTFVVEWEKEARFLGFTIGRERRIAYVGREPRVEVVGNIHDNTELIGGAENG